MKKLLLAGAAVALIASPAAAQNWQTQQYGNDGAAHWALNSSVDTFCKINAAAPSINSYRATATPGDNGQGGTAANSDGTLSLSIQEPTTNTIQNASAFISYANSQCNTPFTITANSQNGGLLNSTNTTTDTAFASLVKYNVGVQFGAQNTGGAVAAGDFSLNWAQQQATAGTFRFSVDVPAQNRLLLQGTYSDFLKVTMTPTI
ncbi:MULTISPECIES: hypothetical protein [unclassified Brevundimonas]|uniref:hypothetical protein n=1 Tax=unclassified Brevundimonas TaxID=2622653 RepID=UPI003F8DE399